MSVELRVRDIYIYLILHVAYNYKGSKIKNITNFTPIELL